MIVLSHFGAFLVHFFGPQKQEKTPLSVFRRGFCQKQSGESDYITHIEYQQLIKTGRK